MKRLNKLFIFLILLAFVPQFSQAKKLVRKPNQAETPIKITVLYGEKVTLFSITNDKNKGRVEFSNNSGAKDSKEISLKDYEYLKTKISKISGISNDKSFCNRNHITINFENKELVGCIGAPNSFAREVLNITNLISILF